MLAVVKTKPGRGVKIVEMETPRISDDEILVEIKACGICGSDVNIYLWNEQMATMLTPNLPVVLGHELSGQVAALGSRVQGFKVGDRVAVEPFITCGHCSFCETGRSNLCEDRKVLCLERPGGMANFMTAPTSCLYKLPETVSYAEGALLETLGVGMHALERMPVFPGNSVAVLGAGPVGLLLLQILKANGASPIIATGTSRSLRRLDLAKKLGADATIVVNRDDVPARIMEITNGRSVDQVFEAAGTGSALAQAFDIVRKGGQICSVGSTDDPLELKPFHMMRKDEIDIINASGRTPVTWHKLMRLVAAGRIDLSSFIDQKAPLTEALSMFELLVNDRDIIKVILEP